MDDNVQDCTAAAPMIGVLSGADGRVVQRCLADFAARRAARCRVAGVVEVFRDERTAAPGKASALRIVPGGPEYPLFQELGTAAESCSLLPEGLIAAGEAVRRAIAGGCDVAVLSKFGKLEADNGSGLVPAFAEALAAGVPILTSVSPRHAAAWDRFAAPFYVMLAPVDDAIDRWWKAAARRG